MSTMVRPAPGPPRGYLFPRTVQRTLANGLTVHVATLRRLPLVTAMLTLDAGAERDPLEKAGISLLTTLGLAEGTSRLDADALADAFERLGGTLDLELIWTRAECGTTVLATHFAQAMALLSEVVRDPVFPESAIDRLRDERLAELLQQRTEPRGLADDMFARFVYSADSRYALPEGGDERTVSTLTRDDVVAHYRARFGPSGGRLIVAGDVEPMEVFDLAEGLLGDWATTPAPAPAVKSEAAGHERRIHVVAKSDAPQSELRIGHTTIPRKHPDFYAIAVMNAILGGLFNSRINLNLREEHAYTYGAFTAFDWRRENSMFEVSTAVRSDVTADAVRQVIGEIDRIREERVSESEISLARDYITGVFPIRFETTESIADAIAMREWFGLESDYYDSYRDRIACVTAEEVRAVAERHLDPSRLQIVAVTDPDAVRAEFETSGLGAIAEYAADGSRIR